MINESGFLFTRGAFDGYVAPVTGKALLCSDRIQIVYQLLIEHAYTLVVNHHFCICLGRSEITGRERNFGSGAKFWVRSEILGRERNFGFGSEISCW